jgi:hypothetical protein
LPPGLEDIGFYLYFSGATLPTQTMKAYKIPLLFLTLFVSLTCSSQETTSRLLSVDSFAKTVKYNGDLAVLTKTLTSPYLEQLFKARAIFKWITQNIRYDCKDYNAWRPSRCSALIFSLRSTRA